QLEAKLRRESLGRDFATLGRTAQSVMDFLDEVLDLERRAGGDFFLQQRELFAAFLVAIVNLHQAADDQSAADQQHRNEKIIAHQAAAPATDEVAKDRYVSEFHLFACDAGVPSDQSLRGNINNLTNLSYAYSRLPIAGSSSFHRRDCCRRIGARRTVWPWD